MANDEDGKKYPIGIYAEKINVGTHDDPNATLEGRKSLYTENGLRVNRISKGEYLIVQTGVKLYSESPDAP